MKIKNKSFTDFQDITTLEESSFTYTDGSGWTAPVLVEYAKKEKLVPFRLYLNNIHIGFLPFKIHDLYDFISHVKRVNNTDLQYPVIMDETGLILDGWHRVAKAILAGKKYVYAVRFTLNPPKDITKREEI